MATYTELRNLMNDSALRNKTATAVIIAADKVMRGGDTALPFSQEVGDHDIRVAWAKEAFTNPQGEARKFLMSVLATNQAADVSVITGATDAVLQTNVEEAVDILAGVIV